LSAGGRSASYILDCAFDWRRTRRGRLPFS
jgi:hypothetical protein